MFDVDEVIQLKEGERVQALVRKHVAMIVPALIAAGALIVVPFFFLFTFVRFGSLGMVIFALIIAFGLFFALKTFYMWDAGVFLITNQRLVQVDQRSLWNRVVSEIALIHVRDLQWERAGIRDSLSKTGAIRIKTGSSSVPDLVIRNIPRPEQVLRLIQELRDHHLKPGQGVQLAVEEKKEEIIEDLEERKEKLHAIVSEADEDLLKKMEHVVHEHKK